MSILTTTTKKILRKESRALLREEGLCGAAVPGCAPNTIRKALLAGRSSVSGRTAGVTSSNHWAFLLALFIQDERRERRFREQGEGLGMCIENGDSVLRDESGGEQMTTPTVKSRGNPILKH